MVVPEPELVPDVEAIFCVVSEVSRSSILSKLLEVATGGWCCVVVVVAVVTLLVGAAVLLTVVPQ